MKHLFPFALCGIIASACFAAPKSPSKTAPAKSNGKTASKVLHYCPIAGEELPSKPVGATTYKGYKIAFCCPGCPEAFAELSAKEKDAKIAKVVAKQARAEAKPKA